MKKGEGLKTKEIIKYVDKSKQILTSFQKTKLLKNSNSKRIAR